MDDQTIKCTICGSFTVPCKCGLRGYAFDTSDYINMPRTAPFLITREAHDALLSEIATLRARIAKLEAPPSEGEIEGVAEVIDAAFLVASSRVSFCERAAKAAIETFMEGRR